MRQKFVLIALLLGCGESDPWGLDAGPRDDLGVETADCAWLELDLPATLLGPGDSRALLALARSSIEGEPADLVEPDRLSVRMEGSSAFWRRGRIIAISPGTTGVHVELGDCQVSSEVHVLEFSPFVSEVLEVSYGRGAGHGQEALPEVILGPPKGGGTYAGSLDVLSLGVAGSITLGFGALQLYDGPGPDFVVFENAFAVGGGAGVFAEPAEVSLLTPNAREVRFPCEHDYPYAGCAGRAPVLSNPENEREPTDLSAAGGDAFDMAGLASIATAIRLTDVTTTTTGSNSGFDLDAVALIHAWPLEVVGIAPESEVLRMRSGERRLAPRVAGRFATGERLPGVAAHLQIEDETIVSLHTQLIHARRSGSTRIRLSAGPYETTTTIEVSDQ